MITKTADGKTFLLVAETKEDFALLDTLDMHGMHLRYMGVNRKFSPPDSSFSNSSVRIQVDPGSAESLRADTGRELARAFGQLVRLGLREAALHGHVVTGGAA